MGFIAVQWENENSLSVVSEEKVVGAVVLKEVTTVDISTGTNKGRVAIYKDTILKVCDTDWNGFLYTTSFKANKESCKSRKKRQTPAKSAV